MTRLRWAGLACALVGLMGCKPSDGLDRFPTKGKLTAKGQPLNGALVRFVPIGATKGSGASARTNAEGQFVLEDDRGVQGGVVAGEYLVSVSHFLRPDGSPIPNGESELENPGSREQMPRKLTSAESSPLRFTVSEGNAEANIDIPEEMFLEKGKKIKPEPPRPGGV